MNGRQIVAAELAEFERLFQAAKACWARAVAASREWDKEAIEGSFNAPLNSPSMADDPRMGYRHSGDSRPKSRIDRDSELRAFILANMDAMTFVQMEEAIAAEFPPERRVGKSAINAWWNRPGRA